MTSEESFETELVYEFICDDKGNSVCKFWMYSNDR